jgi:E3 ubiquitin-protein ligase EDD1
MADALPQRSGRNLSENSNSGGASGVGNLVEEEIQDPLRNEDMAQEGESDTESNFHEAETESDSDDGQSTQDAQRSVQTAATAGSDTGDMDITIDLK